MKRDGTHKRNRVPVVICGGGPVGLSAAIELARNGIASTLFEKHPTTARHPKARNVNSRTMEIFRQWGPDALGRLRALNLPDGWADQIVYARTLAGEEYGRVRTPGFSGAGLNVTTERPLLTSQDVLEPALVEIAEATELVDIHFGHEVTGTDERESCVGVDVIDRRVERRRTIAADYVIAADGARSPIRDRLGIAMHGRTGISHSINVHFDADLSNVTDDRRAVMYWVADEQHRGVFQPLDGHRRWLCQISYDGTPAGRARYNEAGCIDWIRQRIGTDDIDPTILSARAWSTNACVAETFRHGRVFLVGDAAHQMPPTGGFGMNTGIQSAHNLAWKLAHVLTGAADAALLDTFHDERHPVATTNVQRSLENSRYVADIVAAARHTDPARRTPRQAVADAHRYGNFTGMELGYAYTSTAIVDDGSTPPAPDDPVADYIPTARPGHRLPHITCGQPDTSTHDLIGTSLTLLTTGHSSIGDPAVDVVDITRHGIHPATFQSANGIGPEGALLVRPDTHVAARWTHSPTATNIADAITALLATYGNTSAAHE